MQCALKTDTEMPLALDFHALKKGLGLEEEFPNFCTWPLLTGKTLFEKQARSDGAKTAWFLAPTSRAAPGVLASRQCPSKVTMSGLVAYTLHKHRPRGCAELRSCPDMAHEALGPDRVVSATRKQLCFCLRVPFHNLYGGITWQLRPTCPYARHALPLSFPQLVPFSFSANMEPT